MSLSKGHLFLCCLKLFSYLKGKLYSVMSSPSRCLFSFWAGILFLDKPKKKKKSSIFAWETENIFCINGKLRSCIFCVCKYDVLYHSSIGRLFCDVSLPRVVFVASFFWLFRSLLCFWKPHHVICSLKCSICLNVCPFVLFRSLCPVVSVFCQSHEKAFTSVTSKGAYKILG